MIHLVSFFARIEPQQFQECFLSWINSITKKLELEVIAIDGKTMKQSYDRNHSQKPLHIGEYLKYVMSINTIQAKARFK